jgi:hypothetical protein
MTPDKSLQRSGRHRVLGSGRGHAAAKIVMRARMLTSQLAAAELSR